MKVKWQYYSQLNGKKKQTTNQKYVVDVFAIET
jgi:acyl-CoA-binding protein